MYSFDQLEAFPIDSDISWTDHDVMTVAPHRLLNADTTYEVVIKANGLRDIAGNALKEDFIYRFSTGKSVDGGDMARARARSRSQSGRQEPEPEPEPGIGVCPINVTARGETGEEQILLLENNVPIASWNLSNKLQTFTANSRGGDIQIAFVNDGRSSQNADKNAFIDYINFLGNVWKRKPNKAIPVCGAMMNVAVVSLVNGYTVMVIFNLAT